ncbi:MAG: glycosyltransferase family 2 protein [Vicinamibacterales bacterium]
MAANPDVSISIVSYNTVTALRACLHAVRTSTGVACETTVVDNASADGSADMVAREFPDVRLIRNAENRGFAAASNQGLDGARGRHLLLLNPDAVVTPSAIASLARFLDAHPDVGVCGPRVLLADGTLQSCGRTFPTVFSILRQSRSVDRLASWLGSPVDDRPPSSPSACDWVEGACLLIRRDVAARIGPLDERFFLYAEEMDWCHAAQEAGWKVFVLPDVNVSHHQGASTRQVELTSLTHLVKANLQYFEKRRGRVVAWLVAAITVAGYGRQLLTEPRPARAKIAGVRAWATARRV